MIQEGIVDSLDWKISKSFATSIIILCVLWCIALNRGATCYLNSLIQVMYMTPEFRSGLFSVDPLDLGFDLVRHHHSLM